MDLSDSFSSLDESLDEVIDITNENVPTNTSRNGRSASVTGTEGTNYGRDRSKQKLVWSNKHNQLRHRFQAFERDLKSRFYTGNVQEIKEVASSLASDQQKLFLKRKATKGKLVDKLDRLQQSQRHLKKQIDIVVGDNYGRGTYEIKNLHSAFDKLEADIDLFKRGQRVEYNELLHQETTLEKEIFDYNKRFETWVAADRSCGRAWDEIVAPSSTKKSKKYTTPTKEKTVKGIRSSDKRPAALINIERKIENDGSATGGWTARDHALFLRMLSKYQLRSVVHWLVEKSKGEEEDMPLLSRGLEGRVMDMLHNLAERLPTRTIEQIRSHWKWHCTHECRLEKKKQLVREWRDAKNNFHGSVVDGENSVDSSFQSADSDLNGSIVSSANALTPGSNKSYEERMKTKKAILEWKREKMAKEQAEKERKEEKALKEELKRRKDRENRMMLKESIAMYKLQKEAEKAQREAVREVILTARGEGRRRRPPSSETLRRNHERNMKGVHIKRQRALQKQKEKEDRKKRLNRIAESVAPRAIHVDVTRPTAAAMRRRKTVDELDRAEELRRGRSAHGKRYVSHTGAEHARGKSYTFASFSGKKVPSWTKGIRG